MYGTGSYYMMDRAMYQPPPPATPGWQQAPVPGWGMNPFRAGPPRVGVGCAACAAGVGQDDAPNSISAKGVLLGVIVGLAVGYFVWEWNYGHVWHQVLGGD